MRKDGAQAFVSEVVLPHLPQPLTFLGHSMGGNIVLRYLHDHPDVATRAVLSAPMTGIRLPLLAPFVAAWLARTAVAFGAGALVQSEENKEVVVALREIAAGYIKPDYPDDEPSES